MENRKLRVGIVTSPIWIRTGFSNHIKSLLPYLYKTNKYDLYHLNQSVGNDSSEFLRYPWHNEGVFRPNSFDEQRFNHPSEEGFRRHVSYGNCAVQDFVIKNKLDVLILLEDPWAFSEESYLNAKWFPHLKENVLLSTTIDSWPILPHVKTWAEKCSNIWSWASFAEKALKKEDPKKYNHVKTVFGCVDVKDYFPITTEEKESLRKEFNIPLDCKVFIQLGRNQLRKLKVSTLEAFAIFKQQQPEKAKKTKILFHTNFSEPGGWPIERLMKEIGISKEEILATYYCRNCGKWEIKNFDGEDKDCRYCKTPKSQITAGVGSTISNKDISRIYGISDGSISAFTSGGMEYTNPQSLLCKIPLLCTDYSCGEDFTANSFVFKLDGTYTHETGSGFRKHVPNINTIADFFNVIHSTTEIERETLTTEGRNWALKEFSVETIGKRYEEWLDSCKPIEWDYELKNDPKDLKNPNYPLKPIENPVEWIIDLYKNVLNMVVDEKDSGAAYWLNAIKGNMPRTDIYKYFIDVAQKENQGKTNQTIQFEDMLDKNGHKKILVVLKESAGDIFCATSLLPSIKESYPDHDLYFCCDTQYFELLEFCPEIHKLLPYIQPLDAELMATGQGSNKGFFDAYINLGIGTQKILNYLTNNNLGLKLT